MDGGGYVTAGQLGWFNAPLGELIEQLFGEPIPMDNDAMCALYAEAAYGVAGVPQALRCVEAPTTALQSALDALR